MSLRSYRKSPPQFNINYADVSSGMVYKRTRKQPSINRGKIDPYEVKLQTPKRHITIWSLISGFFNDIVEIVSTSTLAGLIVPLFFIVVGIFILWQQFSPTVDEKLKEAAGYYEQGTTSPVAQEYIAERTEYLSDPGAEYFRELSASALKQNILQEDPASKNYNGTFYLTIPAIGFNRLPVQANVESGVDSVYNSVLKNKLAHFKGTGLPISDVNNNIVIYGHSARDTWNPTPNNPEAAFTFISDLEVGDEMILEVEGQKYKFIMSKSKIVKPEDTEIITGTPGKRTLTLFTCYPRGNNSHRIVIVGNPID